MGVAPAPGRSHDVSVNGRLGQAVVAAGAAAFCLTTWGLLSWLGESRLRSILIVPLGLAFYWGLAAVLGSVVGLIFGDPAAEPTRLGMLVVGICSAMFGALLIGIAAWLDAGGHTVDFALQVIASLGFWVSLTTLLGAIFGKLPEIGMAEGD